MANAAPVDVLDVIRRYATGWFPLFDDRGRFYWERLENRAVLPLDQQALARARRVGRRGRNRFDIRFTTAVEAVLDHLQIVRSNTWVKGQVVDIYRALHAAGILRTVEAWADESGIGVLADGAREASPFAPKRLVGGLVGIVLPGVFVAETMYGTVSEASKACLCRLVEESVAAGFEIIDVQMSHDEDALGLPREGHPCMRLGEVRMDLDEFLGLMEGAWRQRFGGGVKQWVERMGALRERGLHRLWEAG
jgi:leucyl/phenylalanyl-tRNA---protein transferase